MIKYILQCIVNLCIKWFLGKENMYSTLNIYFLNLNTLAQKVDHAIVKSHYILIFAIRGPTLSTLTELFETTLFTYSLCKQ